MQVLKDNRVYISVIIPVYNVEAYIEKCLNSVRQQTYQGFECIVVDDGSTDNSGKICDTFASLDARFTVIHKQNGGLVSARKAGLQKASGVFVSCVDSDDWIEKDFLEGLVNYQKKYNADIVAGNHVRDIGLESYPIHNKIPVGLYSRQEILPQLIYAGNFFEFSLNPSLCTKLIRRNILNITQMTVDENIFMEEDSAVLYPSVLEADKILVTDLCGYHYVQRQGSISKSVGTDDLERLRLVFRHLENTFISKGVFAELKYQLIQWKKYICLERQIQIFDGATSGNYILLPYGGIPLHSRIVIYGASALGQTINKYIKSLENNVVSEILWIDKAYKNFQNQGLPVKPPEDIQKLQNEFDYVLIATVTEKLVCSMKECLLELKVPEHKIRWLSEDFLNNEKVI